MGERCRDAGGGLSTRSHQRRGSPPLARGSPRLGVGHELLRAALNEARRDDDLRPSGFLARIRPDNAASIALFTGAGFRHTGDVTIGTWRCLLYEADV